MKPKIPFSKIIGYTPAVLKNFLAFFMVVGPLSGLFLASEIYREQKTLRSAAVQAGKECSERMKVPVEYKDSNAEIYVCPPDEFGGKTFHFAYNDSIPAAKNDEFRPVEYNKYIPFTVITTAVRQDECLDRRIYRDDGRPATAENVSFVAQLKEMSHSIFACRLSELADLQLWLDEKNNNIVPLIAQAFAISQTATVSGTLHIVPPQRPISTDGPPNPAPAR